MYMLPEMRLYWYFFKTMVSYNPTSLTSSFFTEVPVLSQESESSCICVLGISNLPISTIFLFNFWNFSDSVIFLFSFYYRLWKKNYDDVPATGPSKEILQGGTMLLWGLWTSLKIVDLS